MSLNSRVCSHSNKKQPVNLPECAQLDLFRKSLIEQLNPKHPLCLLAKRIPWDILEKKFSCCFTICKPENTIRLLVGLMILKNIENISDEYLIEKWVENPYYQFFCGFNYFQWNKPCDLTDLTYFRDSIGEDGCREIFKVSVDFTIKNLWKRKLFLTTVQDKKY